MTYDELTNIGITNLPSWDQVGKPTSISELRDLVVDLASEIAIGLIQKLLPSFSTTTSTKNGISVKLTETSETVSGSSTLTRQKVGVEVQSESVASAQTATKATNDSSGNSISGQFSQINRSISDINNKITSMQAELNGKVEGSLSGTTLTLTL